MPAPLEGILNPELVIGIAGPIGVDMLALTESLKHSLTGVEYETHTVKLTEEMTQIPLSSGLKSEGNDFYHDVKYKIGYANTLRREQADAATLARIGLLAIRTVREKIMSTSEKIPQKGVAYVVRQLKRPEEVDLLRKIYGRQFILVSAYGSVEDRSKLIEEKLRRTLSTRTTNHIVSSYADELMETDANEEDEDYGQRLRETFHMADVFVDGIRRSEMDVKVERFIHALFGRNDISPSKAEYGMYAAKSASLRSSDLSRQVGAAVFSEQGELITQGCNEVPKAFGGTYWDLEIPDYRDIVIGHDPNDLLKRELLRDLFERLSEEGWLASHITALGSAEQIVNQATSKSATLPDADGKPGPLVGALVMDLTEYGRVVHAEMCAICDAARTGRSLKGAILYCTTFPCHNCTKHILAAGIRKVIYIEPYPKSRAKDLHENEIELEKENSLRVSFLPFLGISPYRYRDIFQKGRRKDRSGKAERWNKGVARPMIDILAPFYLEVEEQECVKLFGKQDSETENRNGENDLPVQK